MKKLFSVAQIDAINAVAEKSKQLSNPPAVTPGKGIQDDLKKMSQQVIDYFKDSTAILITNRDELHEYVSDLIDAGIAGIDTETTGLDRMNDHIVGASLYYPGGTECYIPIRHLVPLFDEPYKNQLSYEDVGAEFQRIADSDVRLIFANADFDLSMIYHDMAVDLISRCYYDVILAWRCLKENERDNSLKVLYNKYVLKGKGDPKKFTDFFTPKLFPYCRPEVAKLYAANDAKITYELYMWQLPFLTKSDPKCIKNGLQSIADLAWNIEFPLMAVCQNMHRRGLFVDQDIARVLSIRYNQKQVKALQELADIVQELMRDCDYSTIAKSPFRNGAAFNPNSSTHVQYLLKTILKQDIGKSVDKNVLAELDLPVTRKILEVRGLAKLTSTYVDKLPKAIGDDGKIHATFNSIGAATGRFSCIARDELVSCVDGRKPISEITAGDIVYCLDDSLNLCTAPVKAQWLTGHRQCISIQYVCDGELYSITCTPEHPIRLSDGRWVKAEELKPGDSLIFIEEDNNASSYSN